MEKILLFYLDYWCESEEIKKYIVAKLNENERKLNEKYDPFRKRRKRKSIVFLWRKVRL